MRHLFNCWPEIESKIRDNLVYLFLDYDGTMAPIAKTPRRAKLPLNIKKILVKLSKLPNVWVAIISGRSLADIKRMVGVRGLVYAGNHAWEISGPGIKFCRGNLRGVYKKALRQLKPNLEKIKAEFSGVSLEDKGATLSIHYRSLAKEKEKIFLSKIKKLLQRYLQKKQIKTGIGKKVIEIKPPGKWDKGTGVLWLLKNFVKRVSSSQILPIYLGDDNTDEDAFRALKGKGVNIFIGKSKRSNAKYYLSNTKEVQRFLTKMTEIKSEVV